MVASPNIFLLQREVARVGIEVGPLDGLMGPKTRQGLLGVQKRTGYTGSDPLSSALGAELFKITAKMTLSVPLISLAQIQAVSRHFPQAWLESYNASLVTCCLDTPLRIAHFTGQLAHESDGFKTLEEYADGSAYEGRRDLGNVQPGDGRRYKGRGVIQLTGRANYRYYGEILGLPLESNPQMAAEPDIAFQVASLYWLDRNLNTPADADDLNTITFRINGGENGLENRRLYVNRGRTAFSTVA